MTRNIKRCATPPRTHSAPTYALSFGIFTVTADASELAQAIGDARWPQHLEEAA